MKQPKFIGKSLFFPSEGVIAVGDLHIGYEKMLRNSGLALPETQTDWIINELEKIFEEIKMLGFKVKKVVFLGDIKHHFGYEWSERSYFNRVLEFLKSRGLKDSDIILIKGNHDKFDFSGKKMKNYWIKNGIAFFHGHMSFVDIFDKKVNTLVMGHLHPSVVLSDKIGIKKEKFKCFLKGKWEKKNVFVLPSFFGMIEGSSVNEFNIAGSEDFSIIPRRDLRNFEIFVVGEDGEVYDFGRVRDLGD